MKALEVVVEENQVVLKSTDRVISVTKNKSGLNTLHFKASTSKVGTDTAVTCFLSEEGLVKNTIVNLSYEAVIELYIALNQYIEEVLE
jgi:hypothetical protein